MDYQPRDILLEICQYLRPYDTKKLALCNKNLLKMLKLFYIVQSKEQLINSIYAKPFLPPILERPKGCDSIVIYGDRVGEYISINFGQTEFDYWRVSIKLKHELHYYKEKGIFVLDDEDMWFGSSIRPGIFCETATYRTALVMFWEMWNLVQKVDHGLL